MLLRYIYDENLAQASYFVGCQETAEAVVIDPARDIRPYLETAEAEEMKIIAAAETHIHADFVSGSRELSARTGARLYLSDCGDAAWKYGYAGGLDHSLLQDGDLFWVGNLQFETMHSPGHTPEHISFLLTDSAGADEPMGIFTGDFVFVGDVGRPDLLETAANIIGTAKLGARQMFSSLDRFRKLPEYLQVWPGHGAGSACGRDLGAVPSSTVGYEKRFNWAFTISDEEPFVKALLADQPETPKYFSVMKRVNKEGPELLGGMPGIERIPYKQLEGVLAEGVPVVDTRPARNFARGHIPGAINIPPESSFSNWAGWLLSYERPFYLISSHSSLAETARNLAAVGLDNCAGYFDVGCIDRWVEEGKALANYGEVDATWAASRLKEGEINLIDVRSLSEWREEHIPGAAHMMLGYLQEKSGEIPRDKPVVVQCRTGTRSSIGASILKAKGFVEVSNLAGGIESWKSVGLPID